MRSTTESRHQSLSLANAIAKICAAAKAIDLRENVKPHERKRIQEAFALLIESHTTGFIPENKSRGYSQLLQKIYNAGGAQLVMVCIVGLGRWAMLSLKEQVKLYLPEEIKKHRDEWDTQTLQSVAQECWTEVHSHTDTVSHDDVALVVVVADVAMLGKILGHFISTGMRLSNTRRQEQLRQKYTKAVRLRLPRQEGDDIRLEIWLHSSFGGCILAANELSVEELRGLLGDHLFMAMKASKQRKEEELVGKAVLTNTVKVSKDSNGDQKLEVTISFDSGVKIWEDAFPPCDS